MCVSEIKYKYISSISSIDDDLLVSESIKFKDVYHLWISYRNSNNPMFNIINLSNIIKKNNLDHVLIFLVNDKLNVDIKDLEEYIPETCSLFILTSHKYSTYISEKVSFQLIPRQMSCQERVNKIKTHIFKKVDSIIENISDKQKFPIFNKNIKNLLDIINNKDQMYECSFDESGFQFDCIYNIKSNSKYLVIINQSACDPLKVTKRPQFQRWSWAKDINASTIVVNDPMKRYNDSLRCGWWIGNNDNFIIEIFVKQISLLCSLMDIPTSNVIFYGGSAGGFSSLQMSLFLKNSICVCDIPQVQLDKYDKKNEFQSAIETSFGKNRDINTFITRINHIQLSKKTNYISNVVYLQNENDTHHFSQHMLPYYFYTKNSGKVFIYTYDIIHPTKGGHTPLGRYATVSIINDLIQGLDLHGFIGLSNKLISQLKILEPFSIL